MKKQSKELHILIAAVYLRKVGNNMEKSKKTVIWTLVVLFVICSVIKDIEFLYIKTDSTFIGENVICKIVCIIATVIAVKKLGYRLSDIGFRNKKVMKYALCGFGLGIVTFAISYSIEMIFLIAQGAAPKLSLYITNFAIGGTTNEISLSITAVIICVLGNVINVVAEEGLFRGIMLKAVSDKWGFKTGNFIQALLFGFWHIISCILGVRDGSMTITMAIVFGFGYVVLAGILAIEWGTCVAMTSVLWVGMFEHFFNNFISNALHVLSVGEGGVVEVDNMQIIRIVLSNILSLTIVLLVNRAKKKRA